MESGFILKCILLLFSLLYTVHADVDYDLTYTIREGIEKETYIGNISKDIDLWSQISSEVYKSIEYSIRSNDYSEHFRIGSSSGLLYTTSPIDRDDIQHCKSVSTCIVKLEVLVRSVGSAYFRKIKIDMKITDLNDNSPVFPSQMKKTVQIPENSIEDTFATVDGASDRDAGNNSALTYHIETPNVPFDVASETYADGRSVVKILVKGQLDREKKDLYQLKIVAEDGGDPVLTGAVDINVQITDTNDNAPEFVRPYYNVTLKEDTPNNTLFETVSATDKDLGDYGKVTYRLSTRDDSVSKMFSINESTGEMRVIDKLVYISSEPLKVFVEASDKGEQPRVSQVLVYIYILDSSNNPPQITIDILPGESVVAEVGEDTNTGYVVAFVIVTDDDTGRNGEVECLSTSDMFGLEGYDVQEYKVVLMGTLNREAVDTYEVTIICEDKGSPRLNSSSTFTVNILDENDNAPRFSQTRYFPKYEENNRVGDIVAKVTATDLDIGNNSKLSYRILNSNGYSFWIDPVTGEIRANFVMDRENVSQITIKIEARDHGEKERLAGTTSVILTVLDQNDNSPKFTLPNYEFFVYEGVPYNTTVDQLTARDRDEGSNGSVSFSFESKPFSDFPFDLFSDGTIKMIRGLDREVQNRYEFNVIASDHGTPAMSSSVTVTVVVLDLNDNAPVFVFPNDSNNTATISLSSTPESVTIVISAHDLDEGANGAVSYSIIHENKSDLFSIETINGVGMIKLKRFPGGSEPNKYKIRVQAEDKGNPKQIVVKPLTILFVKEEADNNRQNFLIAVTLGCITVVLSISIVIIIFLIRRHDKLRNKNCSNCTEDKADVEIVPSDSKQSVAIGSTSSGSRESLKKVSFSTDFNSTLDSNNSKDMPMAPLVNQDQLKMENGRLPSTSSSPRSYTPNPRNSPDPQKLDPATVLHLHRSLLQDQLWPNHRDGHTPPLTKDILKHHEDNGSESSGETATCDSGRGGSESDIQTSYTQSHDPDHIKTVTFANKPMLHHIPTDNHWRNPKDFSSSHPYNQNANNYNRVPPNKLALPQRDYLAKTNPQQTNRLMSGLNLSPIQDAPSHLTSYDDDDDTTTSGSYTIDNDDWLNDCHSQPRPYTLSHNEAYC